jgi:putative chitinase
MSMIELQKKIGVTADGAFGPGTYKRGAAFYKLSPARAAHFFAQTAHESGGFKRFSENLNYSAKGLRGTFGKYFRTDLEAQMYARQPQRIANRVYANRMGNGPESSGDGWLYRGRGALQLTGKDNYEEFGEYIGRVEEVLENPDLVATELCFESALWFFDKNKLWSICDKGINEKAIHELSSRINGSNHPHGLDDRRMKTKKYATWA